MPGSCPDKYPECFYTPGVEHLDFSDHALVLSGIVINDYNNQLSPKLKSKRLWRVSTLAIDHHMQNLTSSGMNNMWLEWRDKFLASVDEIAPRVFYSSRKKKISLSMDDT